RASDTTWFACCAIQFGRGSSSTALREDRAHTVHTLPWSRYTVCATRKGVTPVGEPVYLEYPGGATFLKHREATVYDVGLPRTDAGEPFCLVSHCLTRNVTCPARCLT